MGPGKRPFHTLLATVSAPTYHTLLGPKTMSFRWKKVPFERFALMFCAGLDSDDFVLVLALRFEDWVGVKGMS